MTEDALLFAGRSLQIEISPEQREEGFLEDHLTTDRVRVFKPDPHAYQMGLDAFGLKKEEIAFAAFAGWDVAGAKWFGYPTFWVNRANAPAEELNRARRYRLGAG